MIHLLLVSSQLKTLKMTRLDPKQESISFNLKNSSKIDSSSDLDIILCKHCKRTHNNGIRCLGICVADNEY